MAYTHVQNFFCQHQSRSFDQPAHIIGMIHLAASVGYVRKIQRGCMEAVSGSLVFLLIPVGFQNIQG